MTSGGRAPTHPRFSCRSNDRTPSWWRCRFVARPFPRPRAGTGMARPASPWPSRPEEGVAEEFFAQPAAPPLPVVEDECGSPVRARGAALPRLRSRATVRPWSSCKRAHVGSRCWSERFGDSPESGCSLSTRFAVGYLSSVWGEIWTSRHGAPKRARYGLLGPRKSDFLENREL